MYGIQQEKQGDSTGRLAEAGLGPRATMTSRRRRRGCAAVALLCVAGTAAGAGKSDVADAVMKGDTRGGPER